MSKRAKVGFIFAIALSIAWLAWFYIARERLQAKLDGLTSRHEPVHFSDLDFSPIPDKENAAFYYQSAIAAVSTTAISPSASNFTFPNHPPYSAAWQQMVDQAVAADQQSLSLARRAQNLDRADWGTRLPPSGAFLFPVPLHSLNDARNLANLLSDGARQSHSHGDDVEALQRIFDVLHLADAVQQRGFLVGRLVAIGIQALAIDSIQILATDIQLLPNRPAVTKLIRQLLDEKKARDARSEMARYEYLLVLDDAFMLADHSTVLRPMIDLGIARTIENITQFQNACLQTNWPAAQAILGQPPIIAFTVPALPDPNAPRSSRFVDLTFGFRSDDRYLLTEFRVSALARIAGVSLAVNLYHADHHRWPVNLQSLVPIYLQAVPDDPFYATPHPIGYMLFDGSRPLLFCDTSGTPLASSPPATPIFGWNNNTGTRQWCDVTNWWQKPTPH